MLVLAYGVFNYSWRKYSLSFIIFILFSFITSLSTFATLATLEYSIALIWGNILYIGTVFSPVALLIFITDFINNRFINKRPNLKYFLYIIPSGLAVLFLLKGIDITESGFGYILGPQRSANFLTPLFLTAIFVAIIIILSLEVHLGKKENRSIRSIKVLLTGIVIYFIGHSVYQSLIIAGPLQRFPSSTISMLFLFIFIFMSIMQIEISVQQLSLVKVIDSIKDCIIISDSNGNILRINKCLEDKIIGKDIKTGNKKISAENIKEKIFSSINDRNNAREFFEFINSNRIKSINKDIRIGNDGNISMFNVAGSTIIDKNNKALGKLSIFRDITQRSVLEKKIKYLSFHDNLTGLYNRAYFNEEIKRLDTARQLPLSIIMADIDGLKAVNDNFGHKEGDRLISTVAKILKKYSRKEDIVARWGGDEFITLLPGTAALKVEKIMERIKKTLPNLSSNKNTLISISMGSATKIRAEQSIEAIIEEADKNMYRSKKAKKENASLEVYSH
jgi:diguanylate cyclase (GGDEF)-like protein/PAS domain S-box-containing protein